MFEIYDFLIDAFMAGPLSHAFFPSDDPVASLLSTFATFAVGFVMRPVGAVVIGAYGDRQGRRAALVVRATMSGSLSKPEKDDGEGGQDRRRRSESRRQAPAVVNLHAARNDQNAEG
jgi:hypothetical protein